MPRRKRGMTLSFDLDHTGFRSPFDSASLRDATLSPSTPHRFAMLRSALRLRIASRCYAQDDKGKRGAKRSVMAQAEKSPVVGIIMGSRSDWQTMAPARDTLAELGI